MQDKYAANCYDPSRQMWKGVASASLLGAAIAGLIACLTWLTCAVCSI